jgi:hypothetical protein
MRMQASVGQGEIQSSYVHLHYLGAEARRKGIVAVRCRRPREMFHGDSLHFRRAMTPLVDVGLISG